MKRWFFALVVLAWLFVTGVASAHPTPGSTVMIDFAAAGARIEVDVPVEELERAIKGTLPDDRALLAYAASHLRVNGAIEPLGLERHDAVDGPRVRFRFGVRLDADRLQLHDDIVAHEVVSHTTTVFVRSEWGVARNEPRLVGVLRAGRNDLIVEREVSFLRGLSAIVRLGMEHIATGGDHLLFLLTLLLSTRYAMRPLAVVVSAFTVGHSLTLALGAFGFVGMHASIVEPLIAASILVTAVHAVRPLFPRREAIVAAGFGLVHGLAFASSLPERDLGRAQTMWTLFGFNVGIELAQMLILAFVVPWLALIARSRVWDRFRVSAAFVAGALAIAWVVERTAGLRSPVPVAALAAHPLLALVALAGFALFARATGGGEPHAP